DLLRGDLVTARKLEEFFPGGLPSARLRNYVEQAAAKGGARGFSLAEMNFEIRLSALDETVRRVVGQIITDLTEIIHLYGCDIVLVSGRPSRLPAITSLIRAKMPVPPDRILAMHEYPIGDWYPFRAASGQITDPKTTAVVGAMLCALAEGQLVNFALQTNRFRLRSTARFIGELELSGQIKSDKVFFAGLDVDRKDEAEMNHALEYFAPVFLGFRQLEAERWPATPFYRLGFRDQAAIANARNRLPYKVELAYRIKPVEEDSRRAGGGDSDADEGEFSIASIEDSEGYPVSPADIDLRLQTLKAEEGYWLDTGILTIV
ncbi:MAG: virulence factor SrfB, partial [Alphaproteobacteria bacterium]|nr:virulence factor SrfB [Alphaproteobacteria bacterium]